MAAKVFQLLNGGLRDGKEMKTNGSTIEPGLLVQQDTGGSTVSLADAGSGSFGIAFGNRYKPYRPTSRVFDDNEPLTVVNGTGEALLSADFFTGGTLPSAKDTLYAGAGGLWSVAQTAGSALSGGKVGSVIKIISRKEPVGGVGVTQNLAHVRFNIVP